MPGGPKRTSIRFDVVCEWQLTAVDTKRATKRAEPRRWIHAMGNLSRFADLNLRDAFDVDSAWNDMGRAKRAMKDGTLGPSIDSEEGSARHSVVPAANDITDCDWQIGVM